MRIQLDAQVRTSDGHRAGHVRRAILDPRSNEVTDFVIGTGGLLGHDVLISREILERATTDGDEIAIDLTRDELSGLERYEEAGYVAPPIGWTAPALYDFPTAMYLFPVEPLTPPAREDTRPRRPAITPGMRVKDQHGAILGTVKELRIDDMTGELRSIVVRENDPLSDTATEFAADHLDVAGGEVHVIESPTGIDAMRRGQA
jgi:sporulation protein YlmC with PRC-barrel domain